MKAKELGIVGKEDLTKVGQLKEDVAGSGKATVVAIYCRVAREDSESDRAVEIQKEICCNLLKDSKYVLSKVYVDTCSGNSGFSNRSGLKEMLGDMKQSEFNMMVVSRLDRISRKPDEIKAFMEFAKDYGGIVLDVASYECTVEKIIEFVKREESRFMSEKKNMGLKHKKDKQ